jgi:hypothetical protein
MDDWRIMEKASRGLYIGTETDWSGEEKGGGDNVTNRNRTEQMTFAFCSHFWMKSHYPKIRNHHLTLGSKANQEKTKKKIR